MSPELRERLGKAATACEKLAVMFHGLNDEPTETAKRYAARAVEIRKRLKEGK